MRKVLIVALAIASVVAAAGALAAQPQLKTEDEKTLYALGAQIGQGLTVFNLSKAELEIVEQGMADAVTKAKPPIDVSAYSQKVEALAKNRRDAGVQPEKAKGKTYADKVAKEPGAKRFESGLVFKPMRPGSGASPAATDTVKVNYVGKLVDGTVFDSSSEPISFPLNGVIPCWTEGLQQMKVGGKAMLVCPSSIAYGDQGRPPKIPGGATLVFEVELLSIGGAK